MADPRFVPILLTLPSFTPALALEVLPHGVTLHRLLVQAAGRTHDVLVGPELPATHATQKYTNTIVGRYANRVPVAASDVGGATFSPQANEKPSVSLHGGVTGFDAHVWAPLAPAEARLFTSAEREAIARLGPGAVVLQRTSADGEEGFPGTLRVETLVALVPARGKAVDEESGRGCVGSVVIVYRARLEEGQATPVNLTQHWGFNLDASLQEGEPSVKDHRLSIKASHTLALDPSTALATGALLPVHGTHHDHAAKASGTIGEGYEGGYDEFYLFDAPPHPVPTRFPASQLTGDGNVLDDILQPSPAALASDPLVALSSPKSGLKVVFDSNQSGVQLYTATATTPATSARKSIHGGPSPSSTSSPSVSFEEPSGTGYNPGSAAFLEFHEPHAAFLPALADVVRKGRSGWDTVLREGEVYNGVVRADVWV